jgi:hypothetical protein
MNLLLVEFRQLLLMVTGCHKVTRASNFPHCAGGSLARIERHQPGIAAGRGGIDETVRSLAKRYR